MHRLIRTVVRADSKKSAIDKSINGLRNGMDNEVLPDGALLTLKGDHTPLSPSTYFQKDVDKTACPVSSENGNNMLSEAFQYNRNGSSAYVYEISEQSSLIATPVPKRKSLEDYLEQLRGKSASYWIVSFDLSYDYDATPHKPFEIPDDFE